MIDKVDIDSWYGEMIVTTDQWVKPEAETKEFNNPTWIDMDEKMIRFLSAYNPSRTPTQSISGFGDLIIHDQIIMKPLAMEFEYFDAVVLPCNSNYVLAQLARHDTDIIVGTMKMILGNTKEDIVLYTPIFMNDDLSLKYLLLFQTSHRAYNLLTKKNTSLIDHHGRSSPEIFFKSELCRDIAIKYQIAVRMWYATEIMLNNHSVMHTIVNRNNRKEIVFPNIDFDIKWKWIHGDFENVGKWKTLSR